MLSISQLPTSRVHHLASPAHQPPCLAIHRTPSTPTSESQQPPVTRISYSSPLSPLLNPYTLTPCNARCTRKTDAPATPTVKERTTNGRPEESHNRAPDLARPQDRPQAPCSHRPPACNYLHARNRPFLASHNDGSLSAPSNLRPPRTLFFPQSHAILDQLIIST